MFLLFNSPHHGKGIADSFGGEFRSKIEIAKLKESATTFDEFLILCRKIFNSEGLPPGQERVTFLKFVFN